MNRAQTRSGSRAVLVKSAVLVCVGAGALVLGMPANGGGSVPRTGGSDSITVPLKAVNGSRQSGVAILTQLGSGRMARIRVVVKITKGAPAPGAQEPAHIHNVTCAQYARIAPNPRHPTLKQGYAQEATIVDVLSNVDGGKSISSAYEPLATRTTGHYSINVHQASETNMAVACGTIPRR